MSGLGLVSGQAACLWSSGLSLAKGALVQRLIRHKVRKLQHTYTVTHPINTHPNCLPQTTHPGRPIPSSHPESLVYGPEAHNAMDLPLAHGLVLNPESYLCSSCLSLIQGRRWKTTQTKSLNPSSPNITSQRVRSFVASPYYTIC